MSLNVSLSSSQLVELGAAYMTGGTSMLLQEAAKMGLSQVARQSLATTLSNTHVSGNNQAALLQKFTDAFGSAAGVNGQNKLSQEILDAAYRHGGLQQSMQQLTDAMTKLTTALGAKGQQDSGGSGDSTGESWLEAIAKAMGKALGNMAAKLVDESNALSNMSGDSSSSGAQAFQSEMTKFQADSQMFGMLSDAFSNAIKSIGQGMQTMGNKN